MTLWTHYWRTVTAKDSERWRREEGDSTPLRVASGNLFVQRGVAAGDTVYAITYSMTGLRVLGRMVVGEIVDRKTARKRLGREPWDATQHLMPVDRGATPLRFDAVVPSRRLKDVEFVSDGVVRGPLLTGDGVPDRQTFRGVREITRTTANLFDDLLARSPTQ